MNLDPQLSRQIRHVKEGYLGTGWPQRVLPKSVNTQIRKDDYKWNSIHSKRSKMNRHMKHSTPIQTRPFEVTGDCRQFWYLTSVIQWSIRHKLDTKFWYAHLHTCSWLCLGELAVLSYQPSNWYQFRQQHHQASVATQNAQLCTLLWGSILGMCNWIHRKSFLELICFSSSNQNTYQLHSKIQNVMEMHSMSWDLSWLLIPQWNMASSSSHMQCHGNTHCLNHAIVKYSTCAKSC